MRFEHNQNRSSHKQTYNEISIKNKKQGHRMRNEVWLLLLLCFSFQLTAKSIDTKELTPFIDETANYYLSATHYGGLAISIWHKDRVIFDRGYGHANIDAKIPFTNETVLAIGPVTSTMTAASVLMLAERGKLSLSDKVEDHLPGMVANGKNVSLTHLLCHTSGIVSFDGGEFDDAHYQTSPSVEALIKVFSDYPAEFQPGQQHQYSSSGYLLLSEIIEKVTGQSLGDFYRENLFVPLGLNSTWYLGDTFYIPNFSQSYSAEENILQPYLEPMEYRLVKGAAGVGSTVRNYVRWYSMLMKGYVLSDKSYERMMGACRLKGQKQRWPMTVEAHNWYGDKKMYFVGGEVNGFTTWAMYFPDYDLSIGIGGNTPDNFRYIADSIVNKLIK